MTKPLNDAYQNDEVTKAHKAVKNCASEMFLSLNKYFSSKDPIAMIAIEKVVQLFYGVRKYGENCSYKE
jgi:hypothetical protein